MLRTLLPNLTLPDDISEDDIFRIIHQIISSDRPRREKLVEYNTFEDAIELFRRSGNLFSFLVFWNVVRTLGFVAFFQIFLNGFFVSRWASHITLETSEADVYWCLLEQVFLFLVGYLIFVAKMEFMPGFVLNIQTYPILLLCLTSVILRAILNHSSNLQEYFFFNVLVHSLFFKSYTLCGEDCCRKYSRDSLKLRYLITLSKPLRWKISYWEITPKTSTLWNRLLE